MAEFNKETVSYFLSRGLTTEQIRRLQKDMNKAADKLFAETSKALPPDGLYQGHGPFKDRPRPPLPSQVEAARLLIEIIEEDGEEVPDNIRRIANG